MILGSLKPGTSQATVVGAGMAGLLVAHALDRAGYEVTVYEAAERCGGLISTGKSPWGITERAAHSFLATPPVQELCRLMGVELISVDPRSRARYVWRGGKLRKFPLTVWEALRVFNRAYFILADKNARPEAQTVEDWAKRHLGQPALDYLISPFLGGIYAADPSEIGLQAAFPGLATGSGHSLFSSLLEKRVTRRSKYKPEYPGPKPMMAPKHGMGSLAWRLEESLARKLGPRFKRSTPLAQLREISSDSGNLVLCTPAYVAAKLLEPESPELAASLAAIRYTPMVSVTAFVHRKSFKGREPRGVGVLVPAVDKERECLGVLFNSSSFPGRVTDERYLLSYTVMLGGSRRPELLHASDDEIRNIVTRELSVMIGIKDKPMHQEIHRWERAIPVYSPALQSVWKQAQASWCARPGQMLFGNYTGQVSLRGMIEEASRFEQAARIAKDTK